MVNLGAALFGIVGAWITAMWLEPSAKKVAVSICVVLYAALSAGLLSKVDGLIPGISGSAIGGLSWIAFRWTLHGKATGASRPPFTNGAGR